MEIFLEKSVEKFIEKLEKNTIAKILRTIDLLESFGHKLSLPHCKMIKKNFFELRIRGMQEIRIFYTFKNEKIILFHIFVKKSQKIPKTEIAKAEKKISILT